MKTWAIVGVIVGVLAIVLAWILISPLFIDNVVSEELPPGAIVLEDTGNEGSSPLPPGNGAIEEEEEEIVDSGDDGGALAPPYSGTFSSSKSYTVEGTAIVVPTNDADFLRFVDFSSTNGPDLKVYLATDESASDFVDLGVLKGNIGDQNYEIPAGTDLEKYDTVLIWCRAFSVLFGSAELQ